MIVLYLTFVFLACVIGESPDLHTSFISKSFGIYNDPKQQTNCHIICCESYKRTQKTQVEDKVGNATDTKGFLDNDINLDSMRDVVSTICKRRRIGYHNHDMFSPAPIDMSLKHKMDIQDTGKPCNKGKGTYIKIGWKNVPWAMILSCFYKAELKGVTTTRTFWSRHHIRIYPNRETSSYRYFKVKFFENLGVISAYKNSGYDRGHLAPKADFGIKVEKDMTHFYVNAAPQWSDLNQGEWRVIESEVRKHAQHDWIIYTGTLGKLGVLKSRPKKQLEVIIPKYFFKIVIQPNSILPSSLVFIGKNDIFKKGKIDHELYIRCIKSCDINTYFKNKKFLFSFCCKTSIFLPIATRFGVHIEESDNKAYTLMKW
ncbi:uncharacterized protein LOC123009693 [Tribolium madens]|uniref:uncharacterized protein LOC123009693 n=1 Tax=Tribolium madens TaxID=41895 RepID=UPI001CF75B35|nr:uncharacterized protein LOC123009693 [Tribolium madens]